MRKTVFILALLVLGASGLALSIERIAPGQVGHLPALAADGEPTPLGPGMHLHVPVLQQVSRRPVHTSLRFGQGGQQPALKIFGADGSPVSLDVTVMYRLDPRYPGTSLEAVVDAVKPNLINSFQKQSPEQISYLSRGLAKTLTGTVEGLEVSRVLVGGTEWKRGETSHRQAGYAAMANPETVAAQQAADQAVIDQKTAQVEGETTLAALAARHAQIEADLKAENARVIARRDAELQAEVRAILAGADVEAQAVTGQGRAERLRAQSQADAALAASLAGPAGRYLIAVRAARRFADAAERDGLPDLGRPLPYGLAAWRAFFLPPP